MATPNAVCGGLTYPTFGERVKSARASENSATPPRLGRGDGSAPARPCATNGATGGATRPGFARPARGARVT